ncbi:MAG: AAA family ATPase [Balneolaceae bacterium]
MTVLSQPKDKFNKHIIDFTVDEYGMVVWEDHTVLNDIPGGFYRPLHQQIKSFPNRSLLEKVFIQKPFDDYFPMENWSPGLKNVDEQISAFIKNKKTYYEQGIPYQRSILLYGNSGTGKNAFIYKKCTELIESHDAIVIRIDQFNFMQGLNRFLADKLYLISDRLKIVIIKDVETYNRSYAAESLLTLLNHEEMANNTLIIMTSTRPEAVRGQLLESSSHLNNMVGIFNKDLKVSFIEAWFKFIVGKPLPAEEFERPWFKETLGEISPVHFKELFLSSLLNERSFQEGWEDLITRSIHLKKHFGTNLNPFDGGGFTEQDIIDLKRALEE